MITANPANRHEYIFKAGRRPQPNYATKAQRHEESWKYIIVGGASLPRSLLTRIATRMSLPQ
jgi:hypothetical protein